MKLGIISDIHATPDALRRVLHDMPSVDRLLCAGDAVSEYRFCAETVDLLRQAGAECIQGNHEMVLFGGANPHYLTRCRETFAPDLLDLLADAPTRLEIEAAGTRVLMVHANPWRPFEDYVLPRSPLLAHFAELPYDFVILGHTHIPMVHRAGAVTVVNPGSCSQPRDGDEQGSYAVLDLHTRDVTLRRIPLQ
jgi:putative phosphoesterase